MTHPLRIGFIGVRGIANQHMKNLQPLPDVELAAIADIDEAVLEEVGDKWGIADRYTDYAEMIAEAKLDAISVCTPNYLHADPTIEALEAGKHVLVEKPMATTVAEAEAMCAAAERSGKQLVVGFQFRFNPKAQFLRRQMVDGVFGDVQFVRVQALRRRGIPGWGVFYDKAKQGGGALIDIGVHFTEMAHYVIGKPRPLTVSACAHVDIGTRKPETLCPWGEWNYRDYTVEDLAVGFVRFAGGPVMVIESCYAAHIPENVMNVQVMGSRGGGTYEPLRLFTDRNGYMLNCEPAFAGDEHHFARKMRHFVEVCRGERENDAPGADGLAVQRILNGLYESAESGKEIAL